MRRPELTSIVEFIPMNEIMDSLLNSNMEDNFIEKFNYGLTKGMEYYLQLESAYDKYILEMEGIEKDISLNLEKLEARAHEISENRFVKFHVSTTSGENK